MAYTILAQSIPHPSTALCAFVVLKVAALAFIPPLAVCGVPNGVQPHLLYPPLSRFSLGGFCGWLLAVSFLRRPCGWRCALVIAPTATAPTFNASLLKVTVLAVLASEIPTGTRRHRVSFGFWQPRKFRDKVEYRLRLFGLYALCVISLGFFGALLAPLWRPAPLVAARHAACGDRSRLQVAVLAIFPGEVELDAK